VEAPGMAVGESAAIASTVVDVVARTIAKSGGARSGANIVVDIKKRGQNDGSICKSKDGSAAS
jgi:hypothetical protein